MEQSFDWKKYKKLIPAILGVALLVGLDYLKIERIPGLDAAVLDMIIGGATVFGVYQTKNKPLNAP